jgi:DNA-binding MarR family transcriptional regulator
MGRGLSLVQKRILTLVLQEKFVLCQDLLSLWGVQPGAVSDKARYAAAHSALSRALTRLWWRDLIEYWQNKLTHYRTAVTLTDEGKALAQAIFAED